MTLKVTTPQVAAYDQAAEATFLTRSEWARLVMDAASRATTLPEQMAEARKAHDKLMEKKPVDDGEW